jgi:hypothetical protein
MEANLKNLFTQNDTDAIKTLIKSGNADIKLVTNMAISFDNVAVYTYVTTTNPLYGYHEIDLPLSVNWDSFKNSPKILQTFILTLTLNDKLRFYAMLSLSVSEEWFQWGIDNGIITGSFLRRMSLKSLELEARHVNRLEFVNCAEYLNSKFVMTDAFWHEYLNTVMKFQFSSQSGRSKIIKKCCKIANVMPKSICDYLWKYTEGIDEEMCKHGCYSSIKLKKI